MAADLHSGSPGNYNLFIATSEAKSGQGAPHEIYTSLINISLIFIIYFFCLLLFCMNQKKTNGSMPDTEMSISAWKPKMKNTWEFPGNMKGTGEMNGLVLNWAYSELGL